MNGSDFYADIWHPGMVVTSNYERFGMRFDGEAATRGVDKCNTELAQLETTLGRWTNRQQVLWSSPKQVSHFLYGTERRPAVAGGDPVTPLGLEVPPIGGNLRAVKVRKKGQQPVSEAALAHLLIHNPQHREGLQALMEWSGWFKLRGFYAGLPRFVGSDGRIHSTIRAGTETGRLSSKLPNLQNLPPAIRELFIAGPGKVLVVKDFSGLEWRILAHILAERYGDYSLVDDIVAGVDPHNATAVEMFGLTCPVGDVKKQFPDDRDAAKVLNYSINYGKTGKGLALQLTIGVDDNGVPYLRRDPPMHENEGQALIDKFYAAKPGVKRWHVDCVEYALSTGCASTLLGRRRPLPQLQDKRWWVRQAGERLAMNTPIQGSAMDIVLLSMLVSNPDPDIHPRWHNAELQSLGARQVLQIHDELVFGVPEKNAERVSEVLDNVMPACLTGVRDFKCPLAVSGGIGNNLGDAK